MNNLTASLKWKVDKVCRLSLFLAVLISVLLQSQPALAQERQFDMTLRLVPNRAGFIEVEPGKDNSLFLEVSNIGNNQLTDIKLSTDKTGGWAIRFEPAQIDSIKPGSLQTVNVHITPPGNVVGGDQPINIIAEPKEIPGGKVQNFTLTVRIASLSLRLLSPDRFSFRNEVRAGQDNPFVLEVNNVGNKVVTDIRLSTDTPGWVVSFNPGQIDSLAPSNLRTVNVSIKPPAKATKADTEVSIIADANETRHRESFFFTVKPAQVWIWVWGAAGVAVVGLFVFIYMKFGRQ